MTMGFRKWCSFSLRETILIIAICGCFFAWLREHRELTRAEELFGSMEEAYNVAKSFDGDSAASREVDGVEFEWTIHPISRPNVDTNGIAAGP